jgi:hypothetical protein
VRVDRIEPAEPAACVRLDEYPDMKCPWCGEDFDSEDECKRRCYLSRVNRTDSL